MEGKSGVTINSVSLCLVKNQYFVLVHKVNYESHKVTVFMKNKLQSYLHAENISIYAMKRKIKFKHNISL